MSEQYLTLEELNLPDHKNDLSTVEEHIERLKNKITNTISLNSIDDQSHLELYEANMILLTRVGDLSSVVFDICDPLERMYINKYKFSPALAKALWLEHYDNLHRPYTILKNRCYRIQEELDDNYIAKYNKNPTNWEL
jgi:hypothetical protein